MLVDGLVLFEPDPSLLPLLGIGRDEARHHPLLLVVRPGDHDDADSDEEYDGGRDERSLAHRPS